MKISFFKIIGISALLFACNSRQPAASASETGNSSTNHSDSLNQQYPLQKIKLPPGFSISIYARVPHARSMTLSPKGTLYVGTRNDDKVYAITDTNKDGKADSVYVVAKNPDTPNGVVFVNGDLYIAQVSKIIKLPNIENQLAHPPAPLTVYNKLPTDKHHGWKYLALGPDGKLYVPVGAPCNICDNKNPIYASICRLNTDGSNFEIYARGIRNTVGFTWHPLTRQLWFTDNGRDMMGDDMPGDELNTAPTAGMHFGYPYCHQGNIPDPEYGKGKNCNAFTAPVQVLDAHVAALGMRFYTGKQFPAQYHNQIFIAEHGSWNRSEPSGYRISLVRINAEGRSLGRSNFAEGWLQPDGKVLGRPVDVQVMPNGSLLVSDDYSGLIYCIQYKGS